MSIRVEHLGSGDVLTDAYLVRYRVFQLEQGIPRSEDFDGLDLSAKQFIAYDGENPVGTARYRELDGGVGKVERVAVLPNYRGKSVGRAIMEKLHQVASHDGLLGLMLDSQVSAADFYASLGYTPEGEPFDEVGIPHVKMVREL